MWTSSNALLLLLVLAVTAEAQVAGNDTYQARSRSATAWQRVATSPSQEDGNSIARGNYFDETVGSPRPLDAPPSADGLGFGRSRGVPFTEEFPAKHDAVIVGSFSKYKTFVSPTHKSIYSQIDITPLQTIQVGPNETIPYTVLIPGGTVLVPDTSGIQRTLTNGIEESPYVVQPKTIYLLFLRYHANGAFYTIRKSWIVRNGALLANDPVDELKLAEGRSVHSGEQLQDAIRNIQSSSESIVR